MKYEDSHPSDQQLLLDVEGELTSHDEKLIRTHLDACWKCRTRLRELEDAIADFVRVYQGDFDALPPAAGPRALLKAQLARQSALAIPSAWWFPLRRFSWALAASACGLGVLGLLLFRSAGLPSNASRPPIVSVPDSRLTPGATLLESPRAVCAQASTNNRAVPVALQRKVFEEYGITRADPRAYEVDYLITPALGGADDIHNLWPHSYSAALWNAQVKDALEDHLRQMVCDGSLDLKEAQQEIATDWIAAYKKYFHTDKPLSVHSRQSIQ